MPVPRMLPTSLALVALLALSPEAAAGEKNVPGKLRIDGVETDVVWSDGDSFQIRSGPLKGRGTRLSGYNALESYGPVHRWGQWTAAELYAIASSSAEVAAKQIWDCKTGEADGYGRLLIDCPGLTREMVRQGHGMVYAVGAEADPELLKIQQEAQKAGAGMWAKGVPTELITSLHSADDERARGKDKVYDRVLDTRTGSAVARPHERSYRMCQEVCVGGAEGSCMVFVPYQNRYRNRPDCLEKPAAAAPEAERPEPATAAPQETAASGAASK
jgi:micrococcal nuclease